VKSSYLAVYSANDKHAGPKIGSNPQSNMYLAFRIIGDEWLVTMNDSWTYIPDVTEVCLYHMMSY